MLNILIPLAGLGSRFKEAGYTFPKPLIEINGKAMIEVVVRNLTPKCEHRFIFICRSEHIEKYGMRSLLKLISPECVVIPINNLTEGAACTALLASDYIENGDELIIANSDQYIDISFDDFIAFARNEKLDGAIMTFPATHPKWSFVRMDEDGYVVEAAEKKPISNQATVGIYYYREGRIFVKSAQEMIRKDIRTNNEFYVCPVFNEMVLGNMKIKPYSITTEQMHGLGTPEDFNLFLNSEVSKRI